MTISVKIRPFSSDEWQDLREIRLRALSSNPEVFSSNLEKEKAYDKDRWLDLIEQDNGCVFGLFDDDKIIGLTSIFIDRDDPSGKTAKLAMSYIDPEYRGQNLSRYFYEERIKWAQEHGIVEKIEVSHRESNEPSKRANQAFGFQHIRTEEREWPDGETENEVIYELELKKAQP